MNFPGSGFFFHECKKKKKTGIPDKSGGRPSLQTIFFGHVMRREKLEHLITTGMMEGKRSKGKQREKMTDGLANWLGAGKVVEILKATRDHGIWKDMIANAIKNGTG